MIFYSLKWPSRLPESGKRDGRLREMSHKRSNDIFVNFQLRCHLVFHFVVSNKRFDQIQTRFHSLAFLGCFSDQVDSQFSAVEIGRVFAEIVRHQKGRDERQQAIRAAFLVILEELFGKANRVFQQVVISDISFCSLMS